MKYKVKEETIVEKTTEIDVAPHVGAKLQLLRDTPVLQIDGDICFIIKHSGSYVAE